jgi:hypothetical protein
VARCRFFDLPYRRRKTRIKTEKNNSGVILRLQIHRNWAQCTTQHRQSVRTCICCSSGFSGKRALARRHLYISPARSCQVARVDVQNKHMYLSLRRGPGRAGEAPEFEATLPQSCMYYLRLDRWTRGRVHTGYSASMAWHTGEATHWHHWLATTNRRRRTSALLPLFCAAPVGDIDQPACSVQRASLGEGQTVRPSEWLGHPLHVPVVGLRKSPEIASPLLLWHDTSFSRITEAVLRSIVALSTCGEMVLGREMSARSTV